MGEYRSAKLGSADLSKNHILMFQNHATTKKQGHGLFLTVVLGGCWLFNSWFLTETWAYDIAPNTSAFV